MFDFELSEDEMTKVEELDGGESLFFSHYDPKTVEWFIQRKMNFKYFLLPTIFCVTAEDFYNWQRNLQSIMLTE